ncbi:MAG: hypothetical protein ACR2O4_03045 [Hyphomicrobiaceae bacterium]
MSRIFVSTFVMVLLLAISPAHADAIDGTWCSPSGDQVTIDGPNVITPGGNRIKGDYTRHTMNFQIPAGEDGAGRKLFMEQLHENALRVTTIAEVQAKPGPHEEWRRCQTIS